MSPKNKEKPEKTFLESLQLIMYLYLIIASIVLIYLIFLKLTGNSPTNDQIMLTMLSVILAGMIGGSIKVGMHMGKTEQFMEDYNRKFNALADDFKAHVR